MDAATTRRAYAMPDGGVRRRRNSDAERAEIKRIAGTLGADSALDAAAIYQNVLLDKPDLRARGRGDRAAGAATVRVRDGGGRLQRRRRDHRGGANLSGEAGRGVGRGAIERAAVCARSERGGGAFAGGAGAGRSDRRRGPGQRRRPRRDDPQLCDRERRAGAAAAIAGVDGDHSAADEDGVRDRQGVRVRARPRATSRNCSRRWASGSRRSSSSSSAASSSAACWAGSAADCWAARAA